MTAWIAERVPELLTMCIGLVMWLGVCGWRIWTLSAESEEEFMQMKGPIGFRKEG